VDDDTEIERQKTSNYERRKSLDTGSQKTERKIYIEDQHPSTGEIV